MLVTSMPWDMVVEARGEEVLVEVISAPREQREELSAEQDEAGLGDLDPIASLTLDQKALLETTQTSHLVVCYLQKSGSSYIST